MLKQEGINVESFTPFNTRREQIWLQALHLHDILAPLALKVNITGPNPSKWYNSKNLKNTK